MILEHQINELSYQEYLANDPERKRMELVKYELQLYRYDNIYSQVALREKGCCRHCGVEIDFSRGEKVPRGARLTCISRKKDIPRIDRYILSCYTCYLLIPSLPLSEEHKKGSSLLAKVLKRSPEKKCFYCKEDLVISFTFFFFTTKSSCS